MEPTPGRKISRLDRPWSLGPKRLTKLADKRENQSYLDDQTAALVQTIQSLVGSIRGAADINQIDPLIRSIIDTVGRVISETEASGHADMIGRLADSQQRLTEAGSRGQELAADGMGEDDRDWRMWTQMLPPIAFEIARETKELVQRIDQLLAANDDFS